MLKKRGPAAVMDIVEPEPRAPEPRTRPPRKACSRYGDHRCKRMFNQSAVDSTPTQGSQQAQHFAGILEQSRTLMSESLDRSVTGMLDGAKQAMTALTSDTRSLEDRRVYDETLQVALARREIMAGEFRASYLGEFRRRADRARKIGHGPTEREPSVAQLELVGEDEYDETLRFNAMAGKLRAYCDEELAALDQRVGVLLGDANLQANDNPFSPQVVCDAYKHACRQATDDARVRRVLLKLFDDHVLDDVRAMYKAVNALLIQNAILPKIRYRYARPQEPRAQGAAGAAVAAGPDMPGAASGDAPAGASPDWFSLLQQLFTSSALAVHQPGSAAIGMQPGAQGVPTYGGAAGVQMFPGGGFQTPGMVAGFPGAPAAGGGLVTVLQGPALLGTLTRIQQGDLSAVAGGTLDATSAGDPGTINVLRELKATSVGAGMGAMDLMTLDIIAMLFDQLFDDPKVPNGVKGLIGRMQIPMLKVAIADKSFFSTKSHPARRLLDTLGEIAARLDAGFGPDDPLFAPMQATLEELVGGFKDDVGIFVTVRERLEAVLAEEDQRIERETQAAAKRVEEMERLAIAKMAAAQEVKARVEARKLPRPVEDCLVHQWLKLLLLVHVKDGKGGRDWQRAVEAMDQLIWSIEPKNTREERREAVAVIPTLVRQLALGLKAVGVRSAERTEFFGQLMKLHRHVLVPSGDEAAAEQQEQPAGDVGFSAPDFSAPVTVRNPFGEGDVNVTSLDLDFTAIESDSAAASRDVDAANPVAALVRGTWVEFRESGPQEMRRPARLVFVTPRKTRYLFAFDRAGKDITPYTPAELGRRFRLGGVVIIEEPRDESLFDRIMGGLLGRLRPPAARPA